MSLHSAGRRPVLKGPWRPLLRGWVWDGGGNVFNCKEQKIHPEWLQKIEFIYCCVTGGTETSSPGLRCPWDPGPCHVLTLPPLAWLLCLHTCCFMVARGLLSHSATLLHSRPREEEGRKGEFFPKITS